MYDTWIFFRSGPNEVAPSRPLEFSKSALAQDAEGDQLLAVYNR